MVKTLAKITQIFKKDLVNIEERTADVIFDMPLKELKCELYDNVLIETLMGLVLYSVDIIDITEKTVEITASLVIDIWFGD